jgi:hypothetical protein
MANTRQTTTTSHDHELGDASMMYQDLVRGHIDDLLREGTTLRAERSEAEHRRSVPTAGDRGSPFRPLRVRLGRWLVAVGWAVAGCAAETQGTARRAA